MVVKEIKANYHSYLNEIKTTIDPVITKMREQQGTPWRAKAWLGPARQLIGYAKHLKIVKGVQWASLPIIGPVLGSIAASWYTTLPLWLIICGGILLSIFIYIGYVKLYESRMAILGDDRFHVEAFKVKRPNEYRIWSSFLNKPDFTFEGLYDIVNVIFGQKGDSESIANIVAYTQGQHDFMQSTIEELRNTINSQEEVITILKDELTLTEQAVDYLVGIIKKVNENLYRYSNNALELSDLDFITGFSIYKVEGTKLEKFYDKGTSGSKFGPFDLVEDHDASIAIVDAANSELDLQAFENNPYPGRHVVAFRMKMYEDTTWVWCFHFDNDDERALSLTLRNDIIELRQIRRLVHAFCLVLHKRMAFREEVDQHAEAN